MAGWGDDTGEQDLTPAVSVQPAGQDRQEPEGLTQSNKSCRSAGTRVLCWRRKGTDSLDLVGGGGLWGGAVIELGLTG